jgi:large subunit ribosomal protein L25
MEVGKLNAQERPARGTGNAIKLRTKGQIPAICYGGGQDPVTIQINPADLVKSLDPVKGRNTLLHLHIEGQKTPTAVMLKDTQRDKLRGELIHADFLRVATDKPVRAVVPLVITGKAAGVKEGGTLHQVYRTITVSCVPGKIPTNVEVEISALGIGQSIHVSDLKMPEGVTAALAASTTICVVVAPRAEKGADAAAAAEGAAPAADGAAASSKTPAPAKGGDKAPAKPAAAAAAKPAAKK